MWRSSRAGEVERCERRVVSRDSGWRVEPGVVVEEALVAEGTADMVECVEEGIMMV